MSGHAYFGTGVDKIKHISFYHNGEMKKIKRVWQYHNGVYRQVWTGASTVSYYDGNTLIGTEEIDEGNDALRPQHIDTTKAGYTLYGWKAHPNDTSRLEQLIADGEPISLYAYYVPNTLSVLSASFGNWYHDSGGWHIDYTRSVNNNYLSGVTDVGVDSSWNQRDASVGFYLALNEYQNATVVVLAKYCPADSGGLSAGYASFDGNTWSSWNPAGTNSSNTYSNVRTGNHSLYVRSISYDAYWQTNVVGVTSIVLSNPIAWT